MSEIKKKNEIQSFYFVFMFDKTRIFHKIFAKVFFFLMFETNEIQDFL